MKTPVHTDIQISVHHNTWTVLASRLQGEPLLPSLRRLQMSVDMDDIAPFLFCLSPTIRTFTYDFKREQYIPVLSPILTLISDPSGYPLESSMCQLIAREGDGEEIIRHLRMSTRLRMLEELDLGSIMYRIDHQSIAALSRISRLPLLRTFHLGLWLKACSPTPLLTFSDFASLRHISLHLRHFTFSDIISISCFRAPQLRSINLHYSAGMPGGACHESLPIAEFHHYLTLLCTALPDAFEALQLRLDYSHSAEPVEQVSTLFAPSLSLHNLKTFRIFLRGYVLHVLDDDLRVFASAWPRLEVLSICMPPSDRLPSVAGLIELAKGCPRLREVVLPSLDVSTLPKMSALPSEGHKEVRFLYVGAKVKDDGVAVEDVAEVLDRLFPYLDGYSRKWSGESWAKVQDATREIQAARRLRATTRQ